MSPAPLRNSVELLAAHQAAKSGGMTRGVPLVERANLVPKTLFKLMTTLFRGSPGAELSFHGKTAPGRIHREELKEIP